RAGPPIWRGSLLLQCGSFEPFPELPAARKRSGPATRVSSVCISYQTPRRPARGRIAPLARAAAGFGERLVLAQPFPVRAALPVGAVEVEEEAVGRPLGRPPSSRRPHTP